MRTSITITAVTITTTSIASTSITTAIPMLMTTNRLEPADAPGAMSESETAGLYRLMTWLSPSFPVGAFSYSSGIEWAVEAGDIIGAAHAIALSPSLHAFLHAVVSNWISAGSRLIPLGQTDSQRVLARLEPVVAATAKRAAAATLDDLGSATFRADLASLRHETQYTRLFRS